MSILHIQVARTTHAQQIHGSVNTAINALHEEYVCNEYEGEPLFSGDCCSWTDFSCEDRSDEDEEMCRNYTCLSGFRKTRSDKCIREQFVCDGIIDSEDGSDEENCEAHTCAEDYVKCGDLKTCIEVRKIK